MAHPKIHHFTHTSFTIYKALKAILGITVARAIIFDFIVMPLPFFQSIIAGPTYLLLNKALKNFREPLAKLKAARIKKTRPGIKGMMYPIIPIPVNKNPSATQKGLETDFSLVVKSIFYLKCKSRIPERI